LLIPGATLAAQGKCRGGMLKKITQVLQVVAIMVLAYCAARWYAFTEPEPLPVLDGGRFEQKTGVRDDVALNSRASFAEYRQVFSQREIFVMPYAKEAPAPKAQAVESPVAQKAHLVDFRLRGVVLDQQPQAIVEDLSNKQTLFLSPGDLLGQGTFKEVREDRIIVVVHDASLELLMED